MYSEKVKFNEDRDDDRYRCESDFDSDETVMEEAFDVDEGVQIHVHDKEQIGNSSRPIRSVSVVDNKVYLPDSDETELDEKDAYDVIASESESKSKSKSTTDTDEKENINSDNETVTKRAKKVSLLTTTSDQSPVNHSDYIHFFALDEILKYKTQSKNMTLMLELNQHYPLPMNLPEEPENLNLVFITKYRMNEHIGILPDYFVKYNQEGQWFVYLKVNEESVSLMNGLNCRYIQCIRMNCLNGKIADGLITNFLRQVKEKPIVLNDTFDYPEAVIAEGFCLKLRDYQLRSVSWMKSIENLELNDENRINNNFEILEDDSEDRETPIKLKLGDSGYFMNLINGKISTSSETAAVKPFRVRGGILADDTGSGKTITCLGLIHSYPMTREHAKWRIQSLGVDFSTYIPSRASCIICPSNLYDQWIKEAGKCYYDFKIVGISCIREHAKVSWRDVMMADIVVISYQFLTNTNYNKVIQNYAKINQQISKDLPKYIDKKGKVDLQLVHFYRLFFDEMHEMGHKSEHCKEVASGFWSDFYWGITGTPPKFNDSNDLADLLPYLSIFEDQYDTIIFNELAQAEFYSKFIKRNVPNLQLPPLTTETVWVTANPSELALLNMMTDQRDERDRIMMCCHYQICEKISDVVGETFQSIDDVKKVLLGVILNELSVSTNKVEHETLHLENLIEKHEFLLSPEALKTSTEKIEVQKKNVTRLTSIHRALEGKCNYFKSVFDLLDKPAADDESNECLICRDQIVSGALTILPCAHLYCYECILAATRNKHACPLCQKAINPDKDILRIVPPAPIPQNCSNLANIDTSKYGSKLIALYSYITTLIRDDPNARIILFIQYRILTEFISKTLEELNIQHVRVSGNVFRRKKSIESFKTSTVNRLIILSSEDSVSGINLTEATHVILLHPFWTGKGEQVDLAFEKQGISRAYRGGLDHPLKIVRFAVRGTIDEELTSRRERAFL